MSIKKAPSDRTVQRAWRNAVLALHKNRCLICGHIRPPEELEIHHIVKRRRLFLRHDWRNGVPLCKACHQVAHTKKGEQIIARKHEHYDYLLDHEQVSMKDYLVLTGSTRDEFVLGEYEDLKKIIKENS